MARVQRFRQVIQSVLDLLFPPHCAACERGGHVLCPVCLAGIQPLQEPLCRLCGSPRVTEAICHSCRYHPLRLNGIRAAARFEAPLRPCIHALKYKGCKRIAGQLGTLLSETYRRYEMQADLIAPVPLHREREQQRGYNQAFLLAQVCAQQLGLPLCPEIVQRVRATSAQVDLNGAARRENVAGAFVCSAFSTTGRLVRRRILLIDDVATTGATLEACAAPLFEAGAAAVWGLVLARP